MEDSKNKVEAILFTTGRFMDVEEISKLCGIGSVGYVKEVLNKLIKEFNDRPGSLMVQQENGRFKLALKKEFNYLTANLLSETELDGPTMKTLALIAYKQPVMQSEIVEMRGSGAYDHIKSLKENDFIVSDRKGRTKLIKLSPKFYDYFDIIEGELKPHLNSEKIQKIDEDTTSMEHETKELEKVSTKKHTDKTIINVPDEESDSINVIEETVAEEKNEP
ncbi:MAG: SMC-Scp complex subunit ScpB [Nanoarchaeota archaeon]